MRVPCQTTPVGHLTDRDIATVPAMALTEPSSGGATALDLTLGHVQDTEVALVGL